jgi:microcystin-dependent protein
MIRPEPRRFRIDRRRRPPYSPKMPFIGEIRIFGGSFAPSGWAFCNGQLLSVVGNVALFSVLGFRFGGDGTTWFAVPDLRGRVPIGPGQGPGLAPRTNAEVGGVEAHALTLDELPSHTHLVQVTTLNGGSEDPTAGLYARNPAAIPNFHPTADSDMAADAIATTGSGQPHNNMQPFLTVSYIIALQGDVAN